ncbi:MAG: hypothetical protein WCK02_01970 [Bacteroidota bacterium]
MKKILSVIIFLCIYPSYAQITISKIDAKEEYIASKPLVYDSLNNFQVEGHAGIKQFIGLDIYFPPICDSLTNDNIKNFYWNDSDTNKLKMDSYYTIIDIIFGEDRSARIYNDKKIIIYGESYGYFIFKLKSKINNNIYYYETNLKMRPKFILVPYFIKQQKLYKNQKLIYNTIFNTVYLHETIDLRYIEIYDDIYGEKKKRYKSVGLKDKSKWTCVDVTIMKIEKRNTSSGEFFNEFCIVYILRNEKGEQIYLYDLGSTIRQWGSEAALGRFTLESILLKNINQIKQEELNRKTKEANALAKRKSDCISKFGKVNGELIALKKVKIGMTSEMCIESWGKPLWTNKTTTSESEIDIWWYSYGVNLCFENNILKIISE